MSLFDVYPLYNVTPVSAKDVYVYDDKGVEYLDLYGGHAVISIGHSHPKYVSAISSQVKKLGFYSNAVVGEADGEVLANGDLVINYIISFGSGDRIYSNTYVKQ